MANHRTLSFAKGENWLLSVECTDGAGNPFIVGAAKFELLNRWTKAVAAQFTGSPQITFDGSEVTINLTPGTDQNATAAGTIYMWRCWATDTAALVSDQVEGEFLVRP
jgi:hypothetical protein